MTNDVREVDLVVVGAGAPGLTAAVTAADAGLDVLILERADKVGGVAGVSGGAVWLPLTRFGAAPDTREQVLAYLDFLAAGYGTRAHRERFADASPAVAHYLADQAGVKWRAVEGHVDNFHPWAPGTVVNSRMLEVEPIPGAELGEWQSRTIRSQLFPRASCSARCGTRASSRCR
ncbi:3-oxosteroid 1-dehydrogenase [Mycolicibacterium phlei]|uniref:FAD-dependent oxidoreductase n=1 Tax=Mycolicibacterium phlei TaxID=1771 RepID=UPI00078C85D8|nr:FAD-dependent oxidoreductase [Mycolicibacterium phlei]AMO63846.1 3-oxosteroid 1-dehydrogenase [Mycolicibacterium phlei]